MNRLHTLMISSGIASALLAAAAGSTSLHTQDRSTQQIASHDHTAPDIAYSDVALSDSQLPPSTHDRRSTIYQEDHRTLVLAVGDLLGNNLDEGDLIDVIETAMSLDERGDRVTARFHEATGLILARGSRDQMETLENVIDQLRESQMRRKHDAKKDGERLELEQRVVGLTDQLTRHQAMAEHLHHQRVEMETRANMLEMQVDEMSARLRDREEVIMQLRAELQDCRAVIADLERALARKDAEKDTGKRGR